MTTEPVDLVRQSAEDAAARRRVALAVIATLGVLAVLNLAILSFIANLMWTDHQDRRAGEKQGAQIIGDLYASINRTDARLAELTGKPTPPTVAPPTRTTRTSATAARVTATTAVRPRAATSTTTTATTAPKPPGASTSTTRPPATTSTTCLVRVDEVVCKP